MYYETSRGGDHYCRSAAAPELRVRRIRSEPNRGAAYVTGLIVRIRCWDLPHTSRYSTCHTDKSAELTPCNNGVAVYHLPVLNACMYSGSSAVVLRRQCCQC